MPHAHTPQAKLRFLGVNEFGTAEWLCVRGEALGKWGNDGNGHLEASDKARALMRKRPGAVKSLPVADEVEQDDK